MGKMGDEQRNWRLRGEDQTQREVREGFLEEGIAVLPTKERQKVVGKQRAECSRKRKSEGSIFKKGKEIGTTGADNEELQRAWGHDGAAGELGAGGSARVLGKFHRVLGSFKGI